MAPEIYEENIPSDCKMCGLNDFEENEKGFYCVECGTKVSNLNTDRQANETIEEYQDDSEASLISMTMKWNFPPCISQVNTPKIVHVKQRKIQPLIRLNHSVSYYSYILHDMAEKLVALGAKKEFKLMVLQIWAAYLESKKIVFHKKRPFANTNGDTANGLKSRKRDSAGLVDQVNATTSLSEDGLSSSGTTQHVIQYNKRLKQSGGTQALTSNGHTKSKEENAGGVDILRLYAVLAIALNLAKDDLQLSDLVRFIADGHMRPHNTVAKFPDDVVKKLTKDSRFNLKPSYKLLHEEVQEVAKIIDVETFEIPDMCKLASRYVSELNLPQEIALCVERLINVLPPEMKMRTNNGYPAYEARAMAYIAFVLKLLFGLDGEKEIRIGDSAKEINEVIEQVNNPNSRYPKLFVWSEWVEYVEMRKIIISQNNVHLKVFQNSPEEACAESLQVSGCEDANESIAERAAMAKLKRFFEKYCEDSFNLQRCSNLQELFPSLTPATADFERILAQNSNDINIPELMNEHHSTRSIQPYLNSQSLREFFKTHGKNCAVKLVECAAKNLEYVGIFRLPSDYTKSYQLKQEADFGINKEKWLQGLWDNTSDGAFISFQSELNDYSSKYYSNERWKAKRAESGKSKVPLDMRLDPHECLAGTDNSADATDINRLESADDLCMNSFDVFKEDNMNPINVIFEGPRRNLENISIFKVEHDGETSPTESENTAEYTLLASKMDNWTLLGFVSHFKEKHMGLLEKFFPNSFSWLLRTCAETIGVEWVELYEQLLVVETSFLYGIDNIDTIKDCIYVKFQNPIRDINVLAKSYNEIA